MHNPPDARPEAIGSEIRRYARILHRQRWWVLGTAVVTLALTLTLTALQDRGPIATSAVGETGAPEEISARVLLKDPDQAQAEAGVEEISIPTHAQLITSIDLLEQVGLELAPGLEPEEVLANLTVTVQADSRILSVGYRSSGEESAEEVVRAIADTYIADIERQDR